MVKEREEKTMKKLRKRLMAFGLVMVMAATVLTGCGTGTKNSDSDYEYDPTGTTELSGTFELQIFVGGYGSEAWEEIIDDFEELHPELDVVAYMDSNVNKQMQTRWMQGNPPDFVFLTGSNLPTATYRDEGKLLDLTSFYEKATIADTDTLLKDKLSSNSIRKFDDVIYSLPIIEEAYGIWYDDVYLKELGMTIPTNYDELVAFGQNAKSKGIDSIIYPGISSMYLVQGLIFPALAVYGQDYFDRITTASDVEAFQDERFRDVMTRFKTLVDTGMFSEGTVSLNHIQSQMQWLQHKATFIPNGMWLENEMKEDIPDGFTMNYAVPMMNKADEEQVIVTSGAEIGVATDGDNKEAALEFIRFLYKDENMAKFAEYSDAIPSSNVDLSGVELSETTKRAQAILADPNYKHVSINLSWGSVDAVMKDVVNQMVLGELDVDGAIKTLVEAVEKKLNE